MTELSHMDEAGDVGMVDVGGKPMSRRRAVASARVRMAAATAERLRELPKGDALVTAQLAGIMAAKKTSDLIPLCHPLGITGATIDFAFESDTLLRIEATVKLHGKTGVEMEALVAVNAGLLTIYDMVKAADRGMVISEVRLLAKHGGKSGDFVAA